MTQQELLSKLKVSHKPNIFFGNYEERLKDWIEIRKLINDINDPLEVLIAIFQHCPRTNTKTEIYDIDTWKTGWQLIERNEYNLFDICLLLYYTIILTDNFNTSNILIHTVFKKECDYNNQKFNYIFEMNNQFVDTHSMEKLSKLEFDKSYVLHYTSDIKNKININLTGN